MRKTIAILAAAALTAACGQKIDPNDVRKAMPSAQAVHISTPQDAAGGALTVADVGQPAGYAAVSYWTALTFNGATFWILSLVQTITLFQPTSCDTDSCTWGPWTDQAKQTTFKLDVTRAGDGYDYVLAGHAADSTTFLPVVSGFAQPGSMPHRGTGNFTVSFENGRTIDPTSNDHGTLDVSYDGRTSVKVGALFLGARNDDPTSTSPYLDIAYAFEASATGGELQIMFETTDAAKNLSLRTRWVEGGAGRGDAKYHEAAASVVASQCWAGAASATPWISVYETFQLGSDAPWESGDLAGCGVFSTPEYSTLSLP